MPQQIVYIDKTRHWLFKRLGQIWPKFGNDFWTTYRMPFGPAKIAYPSYVIDPLDPIHNGVRGHEMIHVVQQSTVWGLFKTFVFYFLLPLPALLSGRWWIERPAYLYDIKRGGYTPETAAEALWSGYGWPWPRWLMVRWFEKQVEN